MELCEVSVVKGLVAEHSVNREELPRPEGLLLGDLLQVPRRDSCRMRSKNVFEGFLGLPLVVVPAASVASSLVHFLHPLEVFLVLHCGLFRVQDKEGVVGVSGGMGLWLEEGIEVPERAFHVAVSVHFLEAHLEQDFYELLTSLHEEMQVAILDLKALGGWIELLEL